MSTRRLGDIARALHRRRENTHEVVLHVVQFALLDVSRADAAQLGQNLVDGLARHFVAHRRADDERSGLAAERERRPRAVRVAVLLAQVEIDARVEHAAEQRVHHREREVVFAMTRHADVADADLRLHRLRAIDDVDPARVDRTRRDRGPRRLRAFLPRSERALDDRHGFRRADVAADDDRAVVRHEVLLIEAADVVERDARDALGVADDRVAVDAFAVEQRREALAGDRGRLVALLQDLGQPLAANAVEAVGRQRGAR